MAARHQTRRTHGARKRRMDNRADVADKKSLKPQEAIDARERLMKSVGPLDDPLADGDAVMREFDLPRTFPQAVLAEAASAEEPDGSCAGRLDLRKKFIFTCDPETAKDFDDALSIEIDRKGNRTLGVHIADVSHYVTPGSALDREASKRSTSVYLADRVVPMLPERLSNGVCSLMPGVDRYAFSVFITFDSNGRPVKQRFAKSVIRSTVRFAYEQVMAVIRGDKPFGVKLSARQRADVMELHKLAQQLRANRYAAGALNMEVPEYEVVLDPAGEMVGLEARPYDESHQLVEQCMVAANIAVATELWTRGIHIIARLHESPDPDKLQELRAELAQMGVRCGDLTRPKGVADFLSKLRGPLKPMITGLVLRALKRACYNAQTIGHFGLAAPYYTHFTSPIRRYPDLVVHRQLADFLAGGANGSRGRMDQRYLDKTALHATVREMIADEAERAMTELKKFRFLSNQLSTGQLIDYDAVVTRCTSYGAFVDLPEIGCYGLVHISTLANAYVSFDPGREVLYAAGREWAVGDKMRVRVCRVDFAERHADFVPSDFDPDAAREHREPRRPKAKKGFEPKPRGKRRRR